MGQRKKLSKTKSVSKSKSQGKVVSIVHDEAKRKNIPTAEYQSIMQKTDLTPVQVAIERRNRDLDPQFVWRGKDQQDAQELVVPAPPLYIQEKVHPKVLIDDLLKQSEKSEPEEQIDLFSDFNGLPSDGAKTEFYQHDSHWTNRMILGDSMQVLASLAEREGLRSKVQCIYFDPPYGIKFNSNFQWSTSSRDVKDGNIQHITREPEQVKAFRDTWRDGIHSYISYLRDRLTAARDLLNETGSIFVQIGDENVHRVRAVMDEVFGDANFVSLITMKTTGGLGSSGLKGVSDYIVWYAKSKESMKFRKPLLGKVQGEGSSTGERYSDVYEIDTGIYRTLNSDERSNSSKIPSNAATFQYDNLVSSGYTPTCTFPIDFQGQAFSPGGGRSWKTNKEGVERLIKAGRIGCTGKSVRYRRFLNDYPSYEASNIWLDIAVRTDKQYVVETSTGAIQRCILMTTDPGDLVIDPTCGSGTTAYVAEQWGRRWITIDTSRVALALARARIMGARYPYYILSDSKEGQVKEAELRRTIPSSQPTHGDIRQGFVYERVPHITLKSIANNAEIDVIYDKWQEKIEPLIKKLNSVLKKKYSEWEISREPDAKWSDTTLKLHNDFWAAKVARQAEIDRIISARAEFEYVYDKPFVDKGRIRVAGPFTVESVSPHRVLGIDAYDNFIKESETVNSEVSVAQDFTAAILENLKNAGVQQAHKEDKIEFTSLNPWPGQMICAEGFFKEKKSGKEKRAAILIGPEFGTVSRPDLAEAAKEAGDADFDVLISCAFNYDARSSDFATLGRIPILKARMNADLHMAGELKNTGKGNLFVVFGEPDIEIAKLKSDLFKVKINGVDVFHPNTGEVKSDGADGIACWFIDTDYNEESFFVRHAYFLGAADPYKALKAALKAEINEIAWESLRSDISRPFEAPESGRIAVKVINHLGDEVMKVFKVG